MKYALVQTNANGRFGRPIFRILSGFLVFLEQGKLKPCGLTF